MRKIFFIADYYPPSSMATSTRSKPLVDAIVYKNIARVYVLTDKQSKNTPLVYPNIISSPSNTSKILFRLVNEIVLGIEIGLKIFKHQPHLVVISSPPFFTTVIVAMTSYLLRIKYVLDIRDLYPDVYAKSGLVNSGNCIFNLLKKLERLIYIHSNKIFTVTPRIVEKINSISLNNTCLLTNGFDHDIFKLNEVKRDKFTVVFHGNLGRFQNIELLIELIKSLEFNKNILFVVIGDGPKSHLIKNYTGSNLNFYGRIPNEKVAEIISECHLGLSLRTDDEISVNSLPVKIFEYIGVGIPVLVTPISEGGILVEKNGFGKQFSNDKIDEIIKSIITISENSDVYNGFKEEIISKRNNYSRQLRAEEFAKQINV